MFKSYIIWKIILKLNGEAMNPEGMMIQNTTEEYLQWGL